MPGSSLSTVLKALSSTVRGGLVTGCAGGVLAIAFLMTPAQAAHIGSHSPAQGVSQSDKISARKGSTTVAAKDVETVGSIQSSEGAPNCNRSRKKLWVEDQGWIVRQVTTCY